MNRREAFTGAVACAVAAVVPDADWPQPASFSETVQNLLNTPLTGEGKDGLCFAVTRRALDAEFNGLIADIKWPAGRYGAVYDSVTDNLLVFKTPKSKGVAHFIEVMGLKNPHIVRWVS